MHYFLCVRLEGFYVREWLKQHPECENISVVFYENDLVLDASDDAVARGVVRGMPLRQAKALLSSTTVVQRKEDEFRQPQRDWLNRLVAFSDVIEPVDQHEALIDLSNHPRPQEMAELAITALSQHVPRVLSGFGESKWLASLAVEYGRNSSEENPKAFLARLPVQALELLSAATREKLSLLGYRTIQALRSVPLDVLVKQFPEEGLLTYRLAHAQHFEPVAALYPDRSIGGFFPFIGGTDSLETIAAGCAVLARQVGDKLLRDEQETSVLLLHIEHESRVISYSRTFSKPLRNELSVLASLKLLIEGKTEEPVNSIRITLPHLKRAKRIQNGLFAQRIDNERKLSLAVSTVQGVFGKNALCRASEIELPRRIQLLKEFGQIVGWR